MKRVMITFDYEGAWGMPHETPYDLVATTRGLLDLLDRQSAKAVFFVSGKLVDEYPALIAEIDARGHEIGCHGYAHEHMHNLNGRQLARLMTDLRHTIRQIEKLTGSRPVGFRSPYLMGPKFYDPMVYAALAKLGFTWVSNREIRWPEELFRPGRLRWGAGVLKFGLAYKALLLALNARLVMTETHGRGLQTAPSMRWLLGERAPFARPQGLLEVPLYSPLDCDLLSFPLPQNASGAVMTDFALSALKSCFARSRQDFNLNCHDWITGSADRPAVLEGMLEFMKAQGEVEYYLPGRAGGVE